MPPKKFYDRCCNPFEIEKHKKKLRLRTVSKRLQIQWRLASHDQICWACYKKMLKKYAPLNAESIREDNVAANNIVADDGEDGIVNSQTDSASSFNQVLSQQISSLSELSLEITLPVVNNALALLNASPIPTKKRKSEPYINTKVDNIAQNLKKSLGVSVDSDLLEQVNAAGAVDMITRLKEKFHDQNTTRSQQIQILTLMPLSWSVNKVVEVMNATAYMTKIAKELVSKTGILSTPSSKLGRSLSEETESAVIQFYNDDEISSSMSGMKDWVSVRNDEGKKVKIQKRLILSNLKELHTFFKLRYPEFKIGFSMFASLRPKHCVLAGGSGTHTVCVCAVHQNIKLMMLGGRLSTLTKDWELPLTRYNDCLAAIICPIPTPQCYLKCCSNCPGIEILRDSLNGLMEDNAIEEVTFKRWITIPRASLETTIKRSSEFVDYFCEQLEALLPHSFIAKDQAAYLRNLKDSLQNNEIIVICDFAENYAFVVQDAAPGFHWNNSQATVYPVVIYYKSDDKLMHESLVIISDCLNHNAIAVYVYSDIIIDFIKTLPQTVSKIYYFSDGAPQQNKDYKHLVNLYHYREDYGIEAEWHYFATAHGKGPCDGVGGTVKRMAARASLQLPPDQQITTPEGLYTWASDRKNLPNMTVKYSSRESYDLMEIRLKSRFESAKAIPATQKIHCVLPQLNDTLNVKRFSRAEFYVA